MPKYYDFTTLSAAVTNGTTQTESQHFRMETSASGNVVRITQVLAKARHNTAGGAAIRIKTATSSISTGGTAITPVGRAQSTGAQGPTVTVASTGSALTASGTGTVTRQTIGFAQTGGTGGWTATEPDDCIQLLPKSNSTYGNAELHSIAIGTTVPIDVTVEFSEM